VRKSDLLTELTDVLSDGFSQDLWLLSVFLLKEVINYDHIDACEFRGNVSLNRSKAAKL